MLTTPTSTTIQYSSPTDDGFKNEMTSSESPSDGFVGLPPPPPPPPAPPVFNINNTNNANNSTKILLPQQEVNLVVNRANVADIQARSIPTMLMAGNNIWTRRVLPSLRIKQTVFDQHYGEPKSTTTGHCRRSSLTTSFIGGGGGLGGVNDDGPLSFVLLDATSKMLYDVPMRHLLQLVKKDYDDDASIDHVIRAIDEANMKSEWLDAVTALNKQFDKRPEDKARVLAHKGSTQGLVLIEQFFVKLVRVPAYEFKLIYLKFREEAPTQLERMSKHIHDLLESVQVILNNEQLPGILHLLCLLYNSITGKTIPGLHFESLLSVLSTRTPKQNTTVAHVLCHLLEDQYPSLLNIFDEQILLKLKDLSSIKYIPIYIDIRLLYTRYKQLNSNLREYQQQLIYLPEHIKITLNDLQNIFNKLFDDENKIKKCEKDIANYFCVWDLSIENCFSTIGLFIDKLRLAHMQNVEQRRRNDLLIKQQQQQRTYENRLLQTPTTSRLLRNSQNQYGSDTNIFRDHLNVPLTPTTTRQRYKVNKTSRKRGHSPTTKTILTKRPFNALPISPINNQDQQSDDVFISSNDEQDDDDETKMDCSTIEDIKSCENRNLNNNNNNDDHLLPLNDSSSSLSSVSSTTTTRVISVCEIQPSFYLTTPIRRLFDPSNDQSTPNDSIISNDYKNTNSLTPSLNGFQHLEYSDNDEEHNKENSHYPTPITSSSTNENQNTTELPSLSNPVDDDSQQSSSLSLAGDKTNDENHNLPSLPSLLSDSETLDEGFETQSNVSETVEPTPRSCPIESTFNETNEKDSKAIDQTLADELTQRLTFTTTRRLSADNNHPKRTSHANGRSTSLLKTSASAYSYPTFNSNEQQNQPNNRFTKRTPSAESLRLTSTHNNNNNTTIAIRASRHIQRCAVSRRIWNEKDTDDTSKNITTSPPRPLPTSALATQTSIEPDEVSSSSTLTTTTTTTTTTATTNRRLPSNKSKNKTRNPQLSNDTSSPLTRKTPSRLTHASSCHNVSTISTTNNSKSSPLTKTRSPPSFFLNSSQILRSSFSRPTEKPLRAFQLSPTINTQSSSPKTHRLFSSNTNINSASVSSPKTARKPPSSWHHQKSLTNKNSLTTVLNSSNLNTNRKNATSTIDLRKTNLSNNNTNTFQRLTQSKRL